MALLIAPFANMRFSTSAGNVYLSDNNKIINNVGTQADVTDLQSQGCRVIDPWPQDLLFYAYSLNFNSTSDQQLTQTAWTGRFRIRRITAVFVSGAFNAAAGGCYTAISKGGDAIVAAGQTYATLTGANTAEDLTL